MLGDIRVGNFKFLWVEISITEIFDRDLISVRSLFVLHYRSEYQIPKISLVVGTVWTLLKISLTVIYPPNTLVLLFFCFS
uniref:Uncharacterized protein n=1 Tax=Meloidogyne enterolobii TaxID=390850 RepID=A0A6V7VHQ0_MELEN|nr:unnamed protein product [Meloidogyne enterolobii]